MRLTTQFLRALFLLPLAVAASVFTTGCAVVDAPFAVLDTAFEAPIRLAQSAVDVPMKPVTEPLRDAQRRKSNRVYASKREALVAAERDRLIAAGKLPAPEIGPDGRPIYTAEHRMIVVDPVSSGTLTSAQVGYKRKAKVTTDRTPVDRPLPTSMGVVVPVPKNKAEAKKWRKSGAPAVVQRPAAVHPSQINIRDANAPARNAGAPGSGTVVYQPSMSAPTRRNVNEQTPYRDTGAIR